MEKQDLAVCNGGFTLLDIKAAEIWKSDSTNVDGTLDTGQMFFGFQQKNLVRKHCNQG